MVENGNSLKLCVIEVKRSVVMCCKIDLYKNSTVTKIKCDNVEKMN